MECVNDLCSSFTYSSSYTGKGKIGLTESFSLRNLVYSRSLDTDRPLTISYPTIPFYKVVTLCTDTCNEFLQFFFTIDNLDFCLYGTTSSFSYMNPTTQTFRV